MYVFTVINVRQTNSNVQKESNIIEGIKEDERVKWKQKLDMARLLYKYSHAFVVY